MKYMNSLRDFFPAYRSLKNGSAKWRVSKVTRYDFLRIAEVVCILSTMSLSIMVGVVETPLIRVAFVVASAFSFIAHLSILHSKKAISMRCNSLAVHQNVKNENLEITEMISRLKVWVPRKHPNMVFSVWDMDPLKRLDLSLFDAFYQGSNFSKIPSKVKIEIVAELRKMVNSI